MNSELWNKVRAYDLDSPPSEYGFSIRLAHENNWTKSFTESAVLEYKKFMYLAANSEEMVAPSPIVDKVWHQHLIFSQSYGNFCAVLGKHVQHLPSTHHRDDFKMFRQARERTQALYAACFGAQPKDTWGYSDMFDSLNLEKAKYKTRSFLIAGMLALALLAIPFYYVLRPLYVQIGNPHFIIGFLLLAATSVIALEISNRRALHRIVSGFDPASFVYKLQPLELVYLQSGELSKVIAGTMNELLQNGTIAVHADHSITLMKTGNASNVEQLQVTAALSESAAIFYPVLLQRLLQKPVFRNTANCMNAFRKYFIKSKKFNRVFYFNFSVLGIVLLLGVTRIATGILRDRPVTQVTIACITFAIVVALYLLRLTKMIGTHIIPGKYRREILPQRQLQGGWEWSYFLLGSSVLSPAFVPVMRQAEEKSSGGSSCGTSGGSCGSSCGSCGGCGGGD